MRHLITFVILGTFLMQGCDRQPKTKVVKILPPPQVQKEEVRPAVVPEVKKTKSSKAVLLMQK